MEAYDVSTHAQGNLFASCKVMRMLFKLHCLTGSHQQQQLALKAAKCSFHVALMLLLRSGREALL
jgi:hypothetical protein